MRLPHCDLPHSAVTFDTLKALSFRTNNPAKGANHEALEPLVERSPRVRDVSLHVDLHADKLLPMLAEISVHGGASLSEILCDDPQRGAAPPVNPLGFFAFVPGLVGVVLSTTPPLHNPVSSLSAVWVCKAIRRDALPHGPGLTSRSILNRTIHFLGCGFAAHVDNPTG